MSLFASLNGFAIVFLKILAPALKVMAPIAIGTAFERALLII